MAAFGDPQWQQWADNSTWNYTQTFYTSAANAVPMQVYPALVGVPAPAPEPEYLSPLSWLRGQVSEITELARAA